MKKVFLILCIALSSISVFAQEKGVKSVGAHVLLDLDGSNIGVGVKGRYGFTDVIRGEASFNYFLKNDLVSSWDINANAHYLFPLSDTFTAYPLAGLTYSNITVDGVSATVLGQIISTGSFSKGYFGLNLGGGVDYKLTDQFSLNAEGKYQIINGYSGLVLSAGIVYKF